MNFNISKTQQSSGADASEDCRVFMDEQKRVVDMMIRYYCRTHHSPTSEGICPHCKKLSDYASLRLSKCPFGAQKPNCSQCTVHCYCPSMREEIKKVMKYSGMRMIFYAPNDALVYIFRKIKFIFKKNIK